MAARADFRCRDCGTIREFVFDGTPPPVHDARCCVEMRDKHGVIDDVEHSRFDRKWTPVSIGSVAGAGGSPARTAPPHSPRPRAYVREAEVSK